MARSDELARELTGPEAIRLLAGRDHWHTEPVERLGIGSIHLSDGPVGVRGPRTVGAVSVSFPCGAAIGATFDRRSAEALGAALADECRDKKVHVLLGPTVNLQRHPLGGRHFECYSEDPVLTADLAIGYVRALQRAGVAATVKHFVANDTEFERHTISSDVEERVLKALYLFPFEEVVSEAAPWAVMTSYNRVNGTYAAEHRELIGGLLRDEWHFDGLVMSDWWGAQSALPSLLAGLDLEMPGPPRHYGPRLEEALAKGEVELGLLRERARRVIQLAERTGALDGTSAKPAMSSLGERRELARRLAVDSFVLLRNEPAAREKRPLLPLELRPGALLAVVGPNAERTAAQGGGSARVEPERVISVLEGLRRAYEPAGIDVEYEPGCRNGDETPALDATFRLEYHRPDEDGRPLFDEAALFTEETPRSPLLWVGDPVPGLDVLSAGAFAVRATARFRPAAGGSHELALSQVGRARLLLDGEIVLDSSGEGERGGRFYHLASQEERRPVELSEDREHEIVVEYTVQPGAPVAGLFVGLVPPLASDEEQIERARLLASRASAVVCVVGTSAEWETEGRDRTSFSLPGRQDDLVRAVAAANPRTAVLLNTGSPVEMPWADEAPALLQLWFGGQEVGRAAADVLSGADEPGGRLPHCVPARLADSPAFPYYPGENGHAHYGEGLLMGHRHYATKGKEPRYWFGHGLGYTVFSASELSLGSDAEALVASAEVSNDGERLGSAVWQLYLAADSPGRGEPALLYAGSAKEAIPPGETRRLVVEVPARRLSRLRLAPGGYRVMAGWSAEPGRLAELGEITLAG